MPHIVCSYSCTQVGNYDGDSGIVCSYSCTQVGNYDGDSGNHSCIVRKSVAMMVTVVTTAV
jgi:hypothetical protein